MARLKLLLHNDDTTSFSTDYIRSFILRYFDIVYWQPGHDYDRNNHILVVNAFKLGHTNPSFWYQPYLDAGYKVVIDSLWEYTSFVDDHFPGPTDQCLVLTNKNWFWYNESINYRSRGYDTYQANRTYQKLALMPMRTARTHRNELVVRSSEILDQLLWSYNVHGRYLHTDGTSLDQRHFDPIWYDSTYFSLVTETHVEKVDMFVTEKTFKPMAFYHPFVIVAQPGHLQFLRNNGFETFGNLFDESYDDIKDWLPRLIAVINTVKNFNQSPHNQLTLQKLEHNHNQFYDQSLIETRLVNEIINPMIEYAESR
jgi:hypothetical protein